MNKTLDNLALGFWLLIGVLLVVNAVGGLPNLNGDNPTAYWQELSRLDIIALVLTWCLTKHLRRKMFLLGNISFIGLLILLGFVAHEPMYSIMGLCFIGLWGCLLIQMWCNKQHAKARNAVDSPIQA